MIDIAKIYATEGRSPLDALSYREAMSRVGSAVNIVTTDGPGGRAGFAATAVCSVTDNPPTLLVCVNTKSSVYPAISANGALAVNALGSVHERLSRLFGGKTPSDERFSAARWRYGKRGVPILEDAVVSFECVVKHATTIGTHDVLFCEVEGVEIGEIESALLYCSRKYHTVPC
jgi:flavin reductase